MSVNEGWCIEAICDRCKYTEYLPYSGKSTAKELLEKRGWIVGARAMCPYCRKRAEANRQAEEKIEKQKRRRESLWKR